jgi:hypothetical protein
MEWPPEVSAKSFTASAICDVTSHYSSNERYNLGHSHELHESINVVQFGTLNSTVTLDRSCIDWPVYWEKKDVPYRLYKILASKQCHQSKPHYWLGNRVRSLLWPLIFIGTYTSRFPFFFSQIWGLWARCCAMHFGKHKAMAQTTEKCIFVNNWILLLHIHWILLHVRAKENTNTAGDDLLNRNLLYYPKDVNYFGGPGYSYELSSMDGIRSGTPLYRPSLIRQWMHTSSSYGTPTSMPILIFDVAVT